MIGLNHSSVMVFAMDMSNHNIDNAPGCEYSCCIEYDVDHGIVTSNDHLKKKIWKIDAKFSFPELSFLTVRKKEESFIFQTSPPSLYWEIQNYAYHTLIKIVKSNT